MPGSAIAGTSRTASPAPVHPLRLPPSPVAASEAAFAASSSLIPPPASPSGGVRSRRGTPLQVQQHQHQYQPNRIEADVTRPSLKRIVSSATTIVPASNEGAQSRASLDELSRTGKEGLAAREIIIHEVRLCCVAQRRIGSELNLTSSPSCSRRTLSLPSPCNTGSPSASTLLPAFESQADSSPYSPASSPSDIQPTVALGLDPPTENPQHPPRPMPSSLRNLRL